MKVKYSWIPFVFVFLACIGLRILQLNLFNILSSDFFISGETTSHILLFVMIIFFIIMFILALSDNRTPYSFVPGKNIPLGIVGIFCTLSIFCSCTESLLALSNKNESSTKYIIYIAFAAFAGFVMALESISSLTGKNLLKKAPILAISLPIWSCVRLVIMFMEYTSTTMSSVNMFDLIALIFITVFFFHQGTIFADVPAKDTAKKLFVYGMPAIIAITIYNIGSISEISTVLNSGEDITVVNDTITLMGMNKIMYLIGYITDIMLAFYMLMVMIETSLKVKPVIVKESLDNEAPTTGDDFTDFIREMTKEIKDGKNTITIEDKISALSDDAETNKETNKETKSTEVSEKSKKKESQFNFVIYDEKKKNKSSEESDDEDE